MRSSSEGVTIMRKSLLVCLGITLMLGAGRTSFSQRTSDCLIVCSRNASFQERLAAREMRRYAYLRTGQLLAIERADKLPASARKAIIVGTKQSPLFQTVDRDLAAAVSMLKPEAYLLRTVSANGKSILAIAGADGAGTLYGAYRFAEHLGIGFELNGDVVPDDRIPFVLPTLDETSAPLFKLRGIQPFHDFPEGPDWWNTDDYLAIIGQLPKLRMNFIGLHTYPEGAPNAEPTVWIGRTGEFNKDGTVQRAYPASYQNTVRGNWGYRPKQTSQYSFGAGMLFDRDDYGSEIMRGLTPEPDVDPLCVEVFNRTGTMLRTAFSAAHRLGVKTCVGTETFLTIPKRVKERLLREGKNPEDSSTVRELYKGIFNRIASAYPLDYYWFWTPEGWTWEDAAERQIRKTMTDLSAAIEAAKESRAPFQLATCGWVLGPPSDRVLFDRELPENIAVSCINREVGKAPVDPGFARIDGRSRWAIPWMEDDPSLLAPELWAGRTRRDAADALAYGCDGLLGIHWRTRILSPNFLALSQAAWDQRPWNKDTVAFAERRGALNGTYVALPDSVPIANTNAPTVYRTIRRRVSGYHLDVPNGAYSVTLQFCEPEPPVRHLFDVLLQGTKVINGLDVALRVGFRAALDTTIRDVSVTRGVLSIDFAERIGQPSIAGIVVEGKGYARRINCGGPAYGDYEADAPPTPRSMPTDDLYRGWARRQFGPEGADAAARIFSSIDSRLPEPATWITGPGNVRPNDRPWNEVQEEYAFVDSLQNLRPLVHGKGSLERFDFWLNTFQHMKGMAHLGCLWGAYGRAYDRIVHFQPISPSLLTPPSGSGNGLLGQYFVGLVPGEHPAFTRVDSVVAFHWSGTSPCPGLRPDSFSVRWTGTLRADVSGSGKIGVVSDDGARLWINGKLVVDAWSVHGAKTTLANFDFVAGKTYDVRLEYFQNTGGAEAQLVGGMVSADSVHNVATSTLLPLRREMVETIRTLYGHLLATVTNSSDLGTIANWEQHNFPVLLDDPGVELAKLIGHPLGEDLTLPRVYDGPPRVIVPTVRTMAGENETLRLKVLILSSTPPTEAAINWRPLGSGHFESSELTHINRGVYEAKLPLGNSDVEYYLDVKVGDQRLFFPASAPEISQTVVVIGDTR
jgi:hypothetical protein